MDINSKEVLIGQFSEFIVGRAEEPVYGVDWESLTMKYGVYEVADSVPRFFRSWKWADSDMVANTGKFLKKVSEEDEELAIRIMQEAYDQVDGPQSDAVSKYPALRALESGEDLGELETIHLPSLGYAGKFLEVDNVPGVIYPGLIEDINTCFSLKMYDPALVLTRKLVENLLIDVLRNKYETNRIDTYYDPNQSRFHNLSVLIQNFEENLQDFNQYSGSLDADFIDKIEKLKEPADASAHSIEENISDEDMQSYSEVVNEVVPILFRLKENTS